MKTTITTAIKSRVQSRVFLTTAAFTALTIVCARVMVPLPFTPIPVTLQTMAAVLAGMMLGKRLGAFSQVQYLLIGLMGAPVFANPPFGGPGAILSPSFGYILGFGAGAYVAGSVWEMLGRRGPKEAMLAAVLGALTIHSVGVPWLACVLKLTTGQTMLACASHALLLGFLPFIGADLLKATAAAVMVGGPRLRR
jgi:biotin transport system substrate-specific component